MAMQDLPYDQPPETGEDLVKAVTGPVIQTWLFFGVFHEALGRPILRSESLIIFKDNESSEEKKGLSTQRLYTEFIQRREQIKEDIAWCLRFSCLRQAGWALEKLDRISDSLGGFVIPGIIHLALCALVNTLDDHSVMICQPHIRPANASVGRCRLFEERLIDEDRWCPNVVKRLRIDMGIEGLYYASLIKFADTNRSHHACTSSSCVAHNHAKNEVYLFQHPSQYCPCKDKACSHLGDSCPCTEPINMNFAAAQVACIVGNGQIPLLLLSNDESRPIVQVIPFQQGIKYVAISHVWSDGMGNPHKNSLPLCLFQALDYFVKKARTNSSAQTPFYFWIDTICVPRAPDHLRWAAIAAMRHTYRDARLVLVICQELSSINLPPTPDEILVRIFRSKWMTSLWTLQEGALAAKLAFQFADHAIDYDYLDDLMIASMSDNTTSHLVGNRANISLSSLVSIISFRDSENLPAQEKQKVYSSLWSALRHRTTSRQSDEAICAAILLGVKLEPVLDCPNEERMKVFWMNQDQIPTGVLWVNGPRMNIDSLRWAPESLLDARTWALSFLDIGSWASQTSNGLVVQGVESFWVKDAPLPHLPEAVIEFHDPRTNVCYCISRMENVENTEWLFLTQHWKNCALLWREPPTVETITAGALLSHTRTEGKTTFARWLIQVSVTVKGGEWDHFLLNGFPHFHDGKLITPVVPVVHVPSAEFVESNTTWCIW